MKSGIGTSKQAPLLPDGSCWTVPVGKLGYCVFVVARGPRVGAETDFAFGYLKVELTSKPQSAQSIGPLTSWPTVWIGLLSTRAMRRGRWPTSGNIPGFRPEDWPIPPARAGAVDESEPAKNWGQRPGGEMWSIETTADLPTLALISNRPATRREALQFPRCQVETAASRIESALARHFKGRRPGFWDMKLAVQAVTTSDLQTWHTYAAPIRAAWNDDAARWLPAGPKTDREMRAGLWIAMPLCGGGFGAAMMVARPQKHERFFSDSIVMGMRRRWETWPRLEELIRLRPEDGAVLSPTTMAVVKDGRWRVLGEHPDFDPEHWVYPRRWGWVDRRKHDDRITVCVSRGKNVRLRIDPAILRLDPHAGGWCAGMSSPGAIELHVARVVDGTVPKTQSRELGLEDYDSAVTPARLEAWRKINAAIREELRNPGN